MSVELKNIIPMQIKNLPTSSLNVTIYNFKLSSRICIINIQTFFLQILYIPTRLIKIIFVHLIFRIIFTSSFEFLPSYRKGVELKKDWRNIFVSREVYGDNTAHYKPDPRRYALWDTRAIFTSTSGDGFSWGCRV